MKKHITICICTFKRPELLRRLLSKLEEQKTEDVLDYSIVIVDNDKDESACQVVDFYARHSNIPIYYYVEPKQNISLARNKAIENAEGDFICFIDDDEFPIDHWLVNLYKAVERYKADGILGPVLPYFEREPPKWVLKGHFFDREIHRSGHVLGWENTRTGNVLLRRELFRENDKWFDPEFGRGGEDRDFFRRRISEGHVFVWCNEAPVLEMVQAERWNRMVLIKRALLRGKMALRATTFRPENVLISSAAIGIYTVCLPLFLVLGHHLFMEYLIKDFDHLGKLFAFFGIDLVKEKYVRG